jgi:hypothetical protein
MSLPVIVEIALGMAFVYLLLSIVCSGLAEWWAARRGLRAKFLRRGMVNLIPDQWTYLRLAFHPSIQGAFAEGPNKLRYPSYLSPQGFAKALVDVVMDRAAHTQAAASSATVAADTPRTPLTAASVQTALATLRQRGDVLANTLLPVVAGAGNDLTQIYAAVESWYTDSMERVSGWYKRHTKRNLLIIGIAVAVLANVDSIALFRYFAASPSARTAVAIAAQRYMEAHPEMRPGVAAPSPMLTAEQKLAGLPLPAAAAGDFSEVQFRRTVAQLALLEQQGLPIGFSCVADSEGRFRGGMELMSRCVNGLRDTLTGTGSFAVKLLGWIITGLFIALGAPFWFQVISRLSSLRNSGGKPKAA